MHSVQWRTLCSSSLLLVKLLFYLIYDSSAWFDVYEFCGETLLLDKSCVALVLAHSWSVGRGEEGYMVMSKVNLTNYL